VKCRIRGSTSTSGRAARWASAGVAFAAAIVLIDHLDAASFAALGWSAFGVIVATLTLRYRA